MPMIISMKIGLLGATGPAGKALAARLASVGCEVIVGSRSKYRAMEIRDEIVSEWPDKELQITAAENVDAAKADLIVIASPWDAAATTARSVADQLHGKIVVCMSNAIARVAGEFQPLVPPRGSVAATVQSVIQDSYVAAAMHHVPANELGDLNEEVESDVLVSSDHMKATDETIQLLSKIPGIRPLDAGGLSNATAIEAFSAVILQLNSRYKTRAALRFIGIEDN